MKTLRQIAEELKDQIVNGDKEALVISDRGLWAILHSAEGSIVTLLSNPYAGITLAGVEPDDWEFQGFLSQSEARGYKEAYALRQLERWQEAVESIKDRNVRKLIVQELTERLEEVTNETAEEGADDV